MNQLVQIRTPRGRRTVGVIIDDSLICERRSSAHYLRTYSAWSMDAGVLYDSDQWPFRYVQINDSDTNAAFRTTRRTWLAKGERFHSPGDGQQLFLKQEHFYDPAEGDQMELFDVG